MTYKIKAVLRCALIIGLNLITIFIVTSFINPPTVSTLSKIGSRGSEVTAIQQVLKERSLYKGNIDGIYGNATAEGVKKFQKQQNLTPDGIAGPATLKKNGHNHWQLPIRF